MLRPESVLAGECGDCRAGAPMVWTDAKPTVAGWWWYRGPYGKALLNVELSEVDGTLKPNGLPMVKYTGQWSSRPIDEPKEK